MTMELMMLHEAIDKVKDSILLHLNQEMKKAVNIIEATNDKIQFEVKTYPLDCAKIDQLKEELKKVFSGYEFKVQTGESLDHQTPSVNLKEDFLSRLTHSDLATSKQKRRVDSEPDPGFDPTVVIRKKSEENNEIESPEATPNNHKMDCLIEEIHTIVTKEEKESQNHHFENDDPEPAVLKEVATNPMWEDNGIPTAPDPQDANFNKYLESELDRIKSLFLNDDQNFKSSSSAALVQQRKGIEKDNPRPLRQSLPESSEQDGLARSKSQVSLKNSSSVKALGTVGGGLRTSNSSQQYYKMKFEELYSRSKGHRKAESRPTSKNPAHNKTKDSKKSATSASQQQQEARGIGFLQATPKKDIGRKISQELADVARHHLSAFEKEGGKIGSISKGNSSSITNLIGKSGKNIPHFTPLFHPPSFLPTPDRQQSAS